jgi:hypothetical protein
MTKPVTIEKLNKGPLTRFFKNGKVSVTDICSFCALRGLVPPETDDQHDCLYWIAHNEKLLLKLLKT